MSHVNLWIWDSDHQQNTRFWTAVHRFTRVRMNILRTCVMDRPLEIRTANGARLKHDGGRLVRFMRPDARTIRMLFPLVRCAETHSFALLSLHNRGIGVMFVLTRAHSLSRQQLGSATDSHCSE